MRVRAMYWMGALLLLAGCGGADTPAEEPTTADSTTTAETATADTATTEAVDESAATSASTDSVDEEFCAAVEGAGTDLGLLLDGGLASEEVLADLVGAFTRSAAAAAAITPPEDLAEDWAVLRSVLDAYAAGLAGVDPEDGDALNEAMAAVAAGRDPADFDVIARLGTEIGARCNGSGDASGAAVDVCALLTPTELGTTFVDGAPAGRGTDYGSGYSECVWDGAGVVVRVSILPIADMETDYLASISDADPVADLPGGLVMADVVGIGHASSGGRTVVFESDAGGVMVAVRTGAADDTALAIELATIVAGAL